MKYRIAGWAIVGFLVAGGWALYAFPTMASGDPIMPVILLTCPILLLRSNPLSLYLVLATNAATYALLGLTVEILQRQFKHAN